MEVAAPRLHTPINQSIGRWKTSTLSSITSHHISDFITKYKHTEDLPTSTSKHNELQIIMVKNSHEIMLFVIQKTMKSEEIVKGKIFNLYTALIGHAMSAECYVAKVSGRGFSVLSFQEQFRMYPTITFPCSARQY